MDILNIKLNKFNICGLLIVLLIIGVILSNYIWLKIDQYPAEGHELAGLIPAVQAYRELKGMENTYKMYDRILGRYYVPFCPPLSYLIVVLFYFLFGLQDQMVVMVNSLYIAVTLVCVYLIGKNIFNKRIGLLSTFILSSFPGFISFSRVYWIEFGLMAYVSLNLYLLLKTNFFENRKYSIFLGISLSLSFLHKYEFIVFIIGPLLLVIYKSGILKDILKAKWSNKLTNLSLASGLGLALSSFWWIPYGKDMLGRIFFVTLSSSEMGTIEKSLYLQSIFSFESLTYYLYSIIFLIDIIFLTLFFLSIISTIIRSIIKNEKRFYVAYLILWFIVPYIIFNFFKMKNTSHILSILPSIAILISTGIYFIKNRAFKIILISLIVIYCLSLHSYPFCSIKILNALNYFAAGLSRFPPVQYCNPPRQAVRQEQLERGIKEILEYIKINVSVKEHPRSLVVFKRRAFDNCIFEYYSLIGNYQIRFFTCFEPISDLSECDYIIIERPKGVSITEILSYYDPQLSERKNFNKIFKDGLKGFELVKIYKIPNGNTSAFIYKRKAKTAQTIAD